MSAPGPVICKPWAAITPDEFFEIVQLRSMVFFVEQRIDVVDLDAADRAPDTLHYWISDQAGVAAYLRQVRLAAPESEAPWSFGRVAVRADCRRTGLARLLIAAVVERIGDLPIVIHSQEYVLGLYADYGFSLVGERFFDAGLPHWRMRRPPNSTLSG